MRYEMFITFEILSTTTISLDLCHFKFKTNASSKFSKIQTGMTVDRTARLDPSFYYSRHIVFCKDILLCLNNIVYVLHRNIGQCFLSEDKPVMCRAYGNRTKGLNLLVSKTQRKVHLVQKVTTGVPRETVQLSIHTNH